MIDITSCLNAVNEIKSNVAGCFDECSNKGSTFTGVESLSNLRGAISAIPSGGSSGTNIIAGDFGGFDVTYNYDNYDAEEYTIDFGSYGVNWKSIVCFSDTKDGHFSINKISDNQCIISAACFFDAESEYDENWGIFPNDRNTYRATYTINGSAITFVNNEYEGTYNGWDVPYSFMNLLEQVSTDVNDYFVRQYKLDKITVLM